MKPILLYSLPRAKSTAVLYSCKSKFKLNEPFGITNIHKHITSNESWIKRAELNSKFVDSGQWDELLDQMNSDNTVTKIISDDIYNFKPARSWFEYSIESQTHDVFIIERENKEETLLSYIMARHFGWHKSTEVEPYEFTAGDNIISHLNSMIDNYLRFYPKRGKIITFNNLPESHFDKTLNHTIDQESLSKYRYFKNLDEFRVHIKYILDYHKDEWDFKIRNLDQS